MDHYVNAVVIYMYMKDQTSQFCNKFQDFQHFDSLFSFLIKPESSKDLLCFSDFEALFDRSEEMRPCLLVSLFPT